MFFYVCIFLGYQIGLKSVFLFFWLRFSSTFGPLRHILPGVPPLGLGHCCHSTVKSQYCHNTVTTTDVTLVTIVTAVTLVWAAV